MASMATVSCMLLSALLAALKFDIGVVGVVTVALVGLVTLILIALYGLARAALLGSALPRDPEEE